MQVAAEEGFGQVELFLNSVPLLNNLKREEKMALVDAFDELTFEGGRMGVLPVRLCRPGCLAAALPAEGVSLVHQNAESTPCSPVYVSCERVLMATSY